MSEWQKVDSTSGNANLTNDELRAALADASKLWLAHDGLWFLEWEKRHGMEEAIDADTEAWRTFAKLEARRIMSRLGIKPGGGIPALLKCLPHRLYANICRFTLHQRGDNEAKIRMVDCRVQDARARKDLPAFPCKSVGVVEFSSFARAVDERIEVSCSQCPPDEISEGGWCEWAFRVSK